MKALVDLWTFATAWFNLPFTFSLLAFLGLSALQFVGLEQDHDADADADVHVDVDHDLSLDHDVTVDHDLDLGHDMSVEHDLDVDHDMDLGHDMSVEHDLSVEHDADVGHDLDQDISHDIDQDVDHDVEHEVSADAGGAPAWVGALRFVGVGQAPLTMILLVFLSTFGILGWIANTSVLLVSPRYPSGWMLAAVLGLDLGLVLFVITPKLAAFIGRALPAFSSTATSVRRLVSRRGRVISPQVDDQYGQVKVRDHGGTLITVFAVVDPGKPAIPRDSNVVLVEYDEAKKRYVVVPAEM